MFDKSQVESLLKAPDVAAIAAAGKKALFVQPHPDDNEIGAGGIVALFADKGAELHYLTVTDGRHGNLDRKAKAEETAALRKLEAEAAGRSLGVHHFHYLDHEDCSLNNVPFLALEIARTIRRVAPDIVFCPDPPLPYEAHCDHIATGRACAQAVLYAPLPTLPNMSGLKAVPSPVIAYYFTAKPNVRLDTDGYFGKKMAAIALHKSQVNDDLLAMYQIYLGTKGEGVKALLPLHIHCFMDADTI
jgi:LmbE family N-acetylglucosaminyl deacetylase